MDSLTAYKEKLLPVIKRSNILDDLDTSRDNFQRILITELREAAETISKPKSRKLANMADTIYRTSGIRRSGSIFGDMANALTEFIETSDKLHALIKDDFKNEDIGTDTLTYRQAALLRYVEISQFVFDYSMRFLRFAYKEELSETDKDQVGNDRLTPNEQKFLEDHFIAYTNALAVITQPKDKLEKGLKEVPTIPIDSEVGDVLSFTSGGKADPTRSNFISLSWNPIYRFRMWRAQQQAEAYHRTRSQLQMFEVQRLRIQKSREKTPDPLLDKRANELTGIINELQASINKMEKSYG